MPSSKVTLTNCYTPIPSFSSTSTKTNTSYTANPSRRPDGSGTVNKTRSSNTIRRLCLDRSILSSSTGSSLIELGHTKVLCSVHGPRPATSSNLTSSSGELLSSGVLNCELRYAPMFGIHPETKVKMSAVNLDGYGVTGGGGGSSGSSGNASGSSLSSQEVELSSRLHDAISSCIPLDLLMKNVVDVFVMVLQDDGSVFAASVIAASLALSDAGVEIYDLVSACSVAVISRNIISPTGKSDDGCHDNDSSPYLLLVDPNEDETLRSEAVVTLAFMSTWKEVTFWDQTGRLPPNIASEATELCREGCLVMTKFMRHCLIGSGASEGPSYSGLSSSS